MKIVLVVPPISPLERLNNFNEAGARCPPLGLCYIAATLQKAGHEVRVIDGEALNLSAIEVARQITPDTNLIGITASTISIPSAVETAKQIKNTCPKIPIIIGGPHASSCPKDVLKTDLFELAVIGEGENTVLEIVNRLSKNKKIADRSLNGIAFIKHRKCVITRPRKLIQNIDAIPKPARDLLPAPEVYRPSIITCRRLPATTMITSRGCPYNCIYCSKPIFGSTFRAHSAERVLNELQELIEKQHIKEVWIVDDTFTIDRKRVFEICNGIKKRGLNITWTCNARVDTVTPEMLREMASAGCWQIMYGIESGNQKVLNFLKKSITKEQVINAVNWAQAAGMEVRGTFMIGHPIDTIETIDETINFAKALPLNYASFAITTPFPQTPLYDLVRNKKHQTNHDWSKYSLYNPTYNPPGLDKHTLQKKYKQAYLTFYFRPSLILRHLLSIRSATDLWRRLIAIKGLLSFK